jgi:hypothetical protein
LDHLEIDLVASPFIEISIEWAINAENGKGTVRFRTPTLEQVYRWGRSHAHAHSVYQELVESEEGLPARPALRARFEREALSMLFEWTSTRVKQEEN